MKAVLQQEKRFLIVLFACSLLIRLFFFKIFLADNPCMLTFDSGHYHSIAQQIMEGNGIAAADGQPQFYRLPGYPVVLALGYTVFNGNIT